MPITIASFDIGKHNFSVYVERCSLTYLLKCRKLDNDAMVRKVSKHGEMLMWENISLVGDTYEESRLRSKRKEKIYLSPQHYDNMTDFLNLHDELWRTVDYVVIEMQRKQNRDCIMLAQHCYSYFQVKYNREVADPEYIPSSYKTQKLNAPKIGLKRMSRIEDTNFNTTELRKFSITQLKAYMKRTGISGVSGKKVKLIERIRQYHRCIGDNILTRFDSMTMAAYDIKDLRSYMKNQGIPGKARTKKDVMKLIQQHHGIQEDIYITNVTRGVAIKQWSIKQATDMLRERGDTEALEILDRNSKKDDLADTYNQCQAYKICILENY